MTKDILVNVIKEVVKICDKNNIKIVFSGGIATSFWRRPRATYDIDGIIEISDEKIQNFLKTALKYGFKCEKGEMLKFIGGMPYITIIYSKYKTYVDLFIAKNEFQKQIFSHAKQIKLNKTKISVLSCEDLIILKLVSGRNKDIEDIREILIENYKNLDFKYLKKWARKFNVGTFLKDELESVKRVREIEGIFC